MVKCFGTGDHSLVVPFDNIFIKPGDYFYSTKKPPMKGYQMFVKVDVSNLPIKSMAQKAYFTFEVESNEECKFYVYKSSEYENIKNLRYNNLDPSDKEFSSEKYDVVSVRNKIVSVDITKFINEAIKSKNTLDNRYAYFRIVNDYSGSDDFLVKNPRNNGGYVNGLLLTNYDFETQRKKEYSFGNSNIKVDVNDFSYKLFFNGLKTNNNLLPINYNFSLVTKDYIYSSYELYLLQTSFGIMTLNLYNEQEIDYIRMKVSEAKEEFGASLVLKDESGNNLSSDYYIYLNCNDYSYIYGTDTGFVLIQGSQKIVFGNVTYNIYLVTKIYYTENAYLNFTWNGLLLTGITSSYGEVVNVIYNDDKITNVKFTKLKKEIEFNYENNLKVYIKKLNSSVSNTNNIYSFFEVIENTNNIIVNDLPSSESYKISLNNEKKVTSVSSETGLKVSDVYSYVSIYDKTKITNSYNELTEIYFSNREIINVIDYRKRFSAYYKELTNAGLITSSKSVVTKEKTNLININNFIRSGGQVSEVTDNYIKSFSDETVLKISPNTTFTMQSVIDCECMNGDALVFSIFGKCTFSCNQQLEARITLLDDELREKEVIMIPFDFTNNSWQVVRKVIYHFNDFKKVKIEIIYNGTNDLYLACPCLSISKHKLCYEYSEKDEVYGLQTNKGQMEYDYDDKRNVKRVRMSSGQIIDIEYNSYSQITKVENKFTGKSIKYEYDSRGNNTKVIDYNNDVTTYTYDSNDNLLSEENKGKKISYRYSSYNDLLEITMPNGLKKKIEYGIYNNTVKNISTKNNLTETNEYTYTSNLSIEKIIPADDIYYKYYYDSKNRIYSIDKDSLHVENYTYDFKKNNYETALVSKKLVNGKVIRYSYNSCYNLYKLVIDGTNYNYDYTYDDNDRLIEVKDHNLDKNRTYEYDDSDNVTLNKLTDSTSSVKTTYKYDNQNKVQRKTILDGNERRTYDYEYVQELDEKAYDGFLKYVSTFSTYDLFVPNKDLITLYGEKPKCALSAYKKIDKLNRYSIGLSKNGYITYNVDSINSKKIDKSYYGIFYYESNFFKQLFASTKTVSGFVKAKKTNSELSLFTYTGDKTFSLVIKSNGYLAIKEDDTYKETGKAFDFDRWNYISYTINNYTLVLYYNDYKTSFDLNYECNKIKYITMGVWTYSGNNNIAYDNSDIVIEYSYVSIGNENADEDYFSIYKEGNRILNGTNVKLNSSVKYYNNKTYKDMDVITFNGLYESIKGVKPLSYGRINGCTLYGGQQDFAYDEVTEKIVYEASEKYKNSNELIYPGLCYDLGLGKVGTIALMVKLLPTKGSNNRYILCAKNSNNEDIFSLYTDNTNKLYLKYKKLTGVYATSKHCNPLLENGWNKIAITYNSKDIYVKINDQNTIRFIHVNSDLYDLTNGKVYIGCSLNSSYITDNYLDGQIQMLSFANKQYNDYQLIDLFKDIETIEIKNIIDTKSRISEKVIRNTSNVLHKKYRYHDLNSSYIEDDLIASELDYANNETIYTYDTIGNVTKKVTVSSSDSFLEGVCYVYDDLSRLIKEEHYKEGNVLDYIMEYEYNTYGDITLKKKKDNLNNVIYKDTYTYSQSRLTKVSREENNIVTDIYNISYPGGYTDNHLFPTSINGNNITYIGKNIEGYGEYTYKYNEQGIRVNKSKTNYNIDYIIENNKIVKTKETKSGIIKSVEYHYDEYDMLVGLTYNDKEYFYDRDVLGNINRIIDITGKEYVRYKYTAYGEVIKEINSSLTTSQKQIANTLKEINIFLYKGYCYDEETNLYYCNSRYYSPILCRWITPDNADYLDPESINGMNIYCYCVNNPVMFSDGSGCSPLPWWGKLLIGIGVVIVGAVVTALTAGTGAGFMAAFGAALLTSAKAVAVSTAISAGIGLAMGGLTTGTWDGAINGMLEGAVDGFMWGGIFAGGAQILSGGFKTLAKIGINTSKQGFLKIFTPNRLRNANEIAKIANKGQKFYEYGGTVLKVGKNMIDISNKTFLHMHLWFTGAKHIPLGTIMAGIIGGFR